MKRIAVNVALFVASFLITFTACSRSQSRLDVNPAINMVEYVDSHAKCDAVFDDSARCELSNGTKVYCWVSDSGSATDRWGCSSLYSPQQPAPKAPDPQPAPTQAK